MWVKVWTAPEELLPYVLADGLRAVVIYPGPLEYCGRCLPVVIGSGPSERVINPQSYEEHPMCENIRVSVSYVLVHKALAEPVIINGNRGLEPLKHPVITVNHIKFLIIGKVLAVQPYKLRLRGK